MVPESREIVIGIQPLLGLGGIRQEPIHPLGGLETRFDGRDIDIALWQDVSIGTGTGTRQTLRLPDKGVDYNTIEIKVDGVKYPYFSANTETEYPEITLTTTEGAEVTASYKYGYGMETWNEMELVSQENYGDTGRVASKFEYALPEGSTTGTRTAIKFQLEQGEDAEAESTVVYAVATGWAKG